MHESDKGIFIAPLYEDMPNEEAIERDKLVLDIVAETAHRFDVPLSNELVLRLEQSIEERSASLKENGQP